MRRAEEPMVCAGCGKSEEAAHIARDNDNQLRCDRCAAQRRIEICPVKATDLRAITRRADQCLSVVQIEMDWQTRIDWLTFGEAQLRLREKQGVCELMAYMNGGATDFEHDSAYALSLPLIGLQWSSLHYHRSTFTAWVHPSIDDGRDFHVPRPSYDPTKLPKAHTCTSCKREPHLIVPEGHYLPPFDAELYKLVRGKRVEIHIGPTPEPETP